MILSLVLLIVTVIYVVETDVLTIISFILAFGMENPTIIDYDVSASSTHSSIHSLNFTKLYDSPGWLAKLDAGGGHWIQVDLYHDICINGLVTQGLSDSDQWVTQFKIAVGTNKNRWKYVFDFNKRLHVSVIGFN